jgi:hypothetical protein
MHKDIHYDLSNRPMAEYNALKDCMMWLGNKQFNKVAKIYENSEEGLSHSMLVFGLGMQGIQGYPAEVFLKKFYYKSI